MFARLFVLALTLSVACTSEPDPSGDVLPTGLPDVAPLSGRWVGSAGTGESVDITLTEILNDIGGGGLILRDGQEIEIAVEGRRSQAAVTMRFSAPGEVWNFSGSVSDATARELRGTWSTFGGVTGVELSKCAPGSNFC